MKQIMSETASWNGNSYKNGLPSDAAVRQFRAKHRELSYRNYEAKDAAKLKGEHGNHVEPFFEILEQVEQSFPGLLKDGDRVWNFDETKVDPEFGKKVRVFCDSASHHGGTRVNLAASGTGQHVTAVISVSG